MTSSFDIMEMPTFEQVRLQKVVAPQQRRINHVLGNQKMIL